MLLLTESPSSDDYSICCTNWANVEILKISHNRQLLAILTILLDSESNLYITWICDGVTIKKVDIHKSSLVVLMDMCVLWSLSVSFVKIWHIVILLFEWMITNQQRYINSILAWMTFSTNYCSVHCIYVMGFRCRAMSSSINRLLRIVVHMFVRSDRSAGLLKPRSMKRVVC